MHAGATRIFAILGDSIAQGLGAAEPAHTVAARLTIGLTAAGTPAAARVFSVITEALGPAMRAAAAPVTPATGDGRVDPAGSGHG